MRDRRTYNVQGKRITINRERFAQTVAWIGMLIFSAVYLFGGYKIFTKDLNVLHVEGAECQTARVIEVLEQTRSSMDASDGFIYEDTNTYFKCVALEGERKGQELLAVQVSDNYSSFSHDEIVPGEKVVLYSYESDEFGAEWVFISPERFSGVVKFALFFFLLLVVFGGRKGVNTIISLTFTFLAIFVVFVPSVLAGTNIYLMTFITCLYIIAMTMVFINGISEKSLATGLGCTFGVAVAAAFSIFFDRTLRLTGLLDEHSVYLGYLESGVQLNLNAIIFAMITIGAMGAVMDVAMDIASSLYEIKRHASHVGGKELIKSGLSIGRDIMGTMANTLVLAYIGSSLSAVLLLITYSASLTELLNRESIIVELLQSVIGSTAILLTIPITAVVCAVLYKDLKPESGAEEPPSGAPRSRSERFSSGSPGSSILGEDSLNYHRDVLPK